MNDAARGPLSRRLSLGLASMLTLGLGLLAALPSSCSSGDEPAATGSFVDESVTRLRPLGWLGARGQPPTRDLEFPHQGSLLAPGGVVLRELLPGGALEAAGARVGDVVIGVDDDWLPLKDDASLDLLGALETAISSDQDRARLRCWRDGGLVDLSLSLDRSALELGLPVAVERFDAGAAEGARVLAASALEDGGFEGPDPLAVSALAALALHARWSADVEMPPEVQASMEQADARIQQGSREASASTLGLALATLWKAEQLGPLPAPVVLAAGPRIVALDGASMAGLPEGMSGGTMQITLDDPAQLQELLESMGDAGSVMTFSSSSGDEAPPLELPEGATFRALPPGTVLGGTPERDLASLLAEHDPERPAALEALAAQVARLVERQGEDGAFVAEGAAEGDRLLGTVWSLLALASAQSVGLELDPAVVQRGCTFLRAAVHDGKIAAAVARGADRREEAARAASVALVFRNLGCPAGDDFLRRLCSYCDDHGRHGLEAGHGRGLHLVALAALRRGAGLAAWQAFVDQSRLALVAAQRPDGGFEDWRGARPGALEDGLACLAGDTALGVLLLSMQAQRPPTLVGSAQNPFAPRIDGEGRVEGAAAGALPDGTLPGDEQTMTDSEEGARILDQLGILGNDGP